MGKKSEKERTASREQKIVEKFGPSSTQEKIVDINGTTYGFYTFEGKVFVIDYSDGSDFNFCYLSNEEQKIAVDKLVVKGEYELGVQPISAE